MDTHTIHTIATHTHTTTGADSTRRHALAQRAKSGDLVRIAPGYYLDTEAITTHPEASFIVTLARLLALQHKHPHLIASGPTAAWLRDLPLLREHPLHVTTTSDHHPRPVTLPEIHAGHLHVPAVTVRPHRPRGGRSPAMNRYDGDLMGATLEDTIIDCALALDREEAFVVACAGLHKLARYRRFYRDDSRRREENNRSRLLRLIGSIGPHTPGKNLCTLGDHTRGCRVRECGGIALALPAGARRPAGVGNSVPGFSSE